MTESIVVVFEIVEIDIEQHIAADIALGADDFCLTAEAVTVGNACQMVCNGRLFQFAVHAFDRHSAVDFSDRFAEMAECGFKYHKVIAVEKDTAGDRAFSDFDISEENGFAAGFLHNGNADHCHDRFIEEIHDGQELIEILVGTVGEKRLLVHMEKAEYPVKYLIGEFRGGTFPAGRTGGKTSGFSGRRQSGGQSGSLGGRSD